MTRDVLNKKALSYLGFARKAGRVLIGTDAVLKGARSAPGRIAVVLASDASERTRKQINDKCAFYGVHISPASPTGDEIARAVGKRMTVSAAAITDEGLASALITASDGIENANTQLEERIFPQDREKR